MASSWKNDERQFLEFSGIYFLDKCVSNGCSKGKSPCSPIMISNANEIKSSNARYGYFPIIEYLIKKDLIVTSVLSNIRLFFYSQRIYIYMVNISIFKVYLWTKLGLFIVFWTWFTIQWFTCSQLLWTLEIISCTLHIFVGRKCFFLE